MKRSTVLDLWRIVAIALVFCFHAPRAEMGGWTRYGWMGVDVFFVLSGFLTFTQNFGLESSAFSHAWSLCIEEQFYLFAPLLLVFGRRSSFVIALLIIVGGGVYRHFAWLEFSRATSADRWSDYLRLIYFPTWGRLDGLVVGVGAAWVSMGRIVDTNGRVHERVSTRVYAAIGLIALIASFALFRDRLSYMASVFGYPLLAIGIGGLLLATSEFQLREMKVINVLAICSYSFYLVHKQVLHHAGSSPVALALSIAIAIAMYVAIERPFLLWGDRLLRKSMPGHHTA